MIHPANTPHPAQPAPAAEPSVFVIPGPCYADAEHAGEMPLSDALARFGDLTAWIVARHEAKAYAFDDASFGRPGAGRVHLQVEDSGDEVAAVLVVLDEDTAWVAGGSGVALRDWFAPMHDRFAPRLPADLAPGEVVSLAVQPAMGRSLFLPYPYHVRPDGSIGRQDQWRGKVTHVLGFQDDWTSGDIDVPLSAFVAAPHLALGRHPVLTNPAGRTFSVDIPVESVHASAIARPDDYDGPAVFERKEQAR